jgi:hypothetical protein
MGFLIAETTLMILIAAAAGAAFSYWWVRRQYRDVTAEYESLKVDLQTAESRLAAPPLELTPHEEPKPQSRISPEAMAALLSKVEQSVSGANDAHIARVMAMEGQLRTLSRQLQDVLPHPVDGQDIARRLDTLGAAIPQPKLNHMDARMGRLETMVASLCTHAGMEVPAAPMLSRLPSAPTNSRLPSSPANGRLGSAIESKLPGTNAESRSPSTPAQRAPLPPASQRPAGVAAERSPSTSSAPTSTAPSSAPNSAVPGPPSSLPPRAPRPRRTEQL